MVIYIAEACWLLVRSLMSLASECESCGRPLSSNADHGAQNPDNPYCIHCTDLKGKLLPFEKIDEAWVSQAMQTRWMNKAQAEKFALEAMGKWHAWKEKDSDMPTPE